LADPRHRRSTDASFPDRHPNQQIAHVHSSNATDS
jgi:hypothetical protein